MILLCHHFFLSLSLLLLFISLSTDSPPLLWFSLFFPLLLCVSFLFPSYCISLFFSSPLTIYLSLSLPLLLRISLSLSVSYFFLFSISFFIFFSLSLSLSLSYLFHYISLYFSLSFSPLTAYLWMFLSLYQILYGFDV